MTFKKIRFIADSTCDIPPEVLRKWDITIIPAFVNYGGGSYADDGIELDRVAYYDQLPSMTSQPTTAAPSPGVTEAIITKVAAECDHVVMLTVPARLSGIYNAFRLGASSLPPDTYTLIDSFTTTMAMGFQVLVGVEVAAETGDVSAVVNAIERARRNIKLYAAPESMVYLRRSGRVGWAAAGAATLLQIKPIVSVVDDGVVESTARVRTFSKAVEKMVELALAQAPLDRLALLHTNNPEGAQDMKRQMGSAVPAETYIINVTPVLGTHAGPRRWASSLLVKLGDNRLDMPSALETLVKILKLEREQGCKNSAVIGGLAAFSEKWSQDAHTQARKPEHHLLVDELTGLLHQYDQIEAKADRVVRIAYMLDRITGRVPAPPEFSAPAAPPPPPPETSTAPPPEATVPPQTVQNTPAPREERREQRPRCEDRRHSEAHKTEKPAADSGESQPALEQRPRHERLDRPKQHQPQGQQQNRPQNNRKPQKPSREQGEEDDGDEGGEIFRERGDDMSYDSYDAPVRSRGGRGQQVEMDIAPMPRLARVPRRPRPKVSVEEAADLLRGLNQPVTVLRGVGPGMAKMLEKLGIHTVNDMLYYLPRRYDDYTNLQTIAKLVPDPDKLVTVVGTVVHAEIRIGRGNRKDFFMVLDDGTARMGITFFGRHFMIRQVKKGHQLVVSGVITMFGRQVQMTNPEWEPLETENLHTTGIVPVYPLTDGLSGRSLRKLMKSAIDYWSERVPDFVPEGTLERTELGDLGWALKNVHFPEGWDHLALARKRLVFDDLLTLQLAMLMNRREWQSIPAQPLDVSDDYLNEFMQTVFPYPLTGAQRRAIEDVRHDVALIRPMNRLLQGDVGSGKTAVATVVIAMALAKSKQAALMVPTSILAEQHYRGITATLAKMPGDRKPVVALLTGALSSSERQSIYRGISDGSIDVVIGTHALIQEGVDFKDLAVAIIDEQHRFGVEQRKALRGKGTNPHLLVMTATPIPRTLALTIHADLDLSIIDEMPPGRIPIQTKVVQPVAREQVNNFIIKQINEGRQAFVVHPLVEASEKIEAPAAMEAYERLQQVFFRNKVGLLHGRMRPAEKDEVMEAFANGTYDVLVTTSVAEVGVNVPNASVMVIEGANRFGLSQLHQFRGRVGRGEHASYCLLLSDTNSEEAKQRLQAMEETTDGFKLAEMDWKLRGAGDLIGTKQSGGNKLQLAELMTPQLVEMAQRESRTIYEEDPNFVQEEHRLLAQRVVMLHNERSDVS